MSFQVLHHPVHHVSHAFTNPPQGMPVHSLPVHAMQAHTMPVHTMPPQTVPQLWQPVGQFTGHHIQNHSLTHSHQPRGPTPTYPYNINPGGRGSQGQGPPRRQGFSRGFPQRGFGGRSRGVRGRGRGFQPFQSPPLPQPPSNSALIVIQVRYSCYLLFVLVFGRKGNT